MTASDQQCNQEVEAIAEHTGGVNHRQLKLFESGKARQNKRSISDAALTGRAPSDRLLAEHR